MLPHLRRLLLSLCMLSFAMVVLPLRSAADDAVVHLPKYTVVGKFSDLVCAARFRFHLPGARLKALVLRATPASWKKLGIEPGDWIVAIDGRPVDGQSLRQLCLYLDKKLKDRRFGLDLVIRQQHAAKPIQIRAEFDKDSDHFTIVYP